MQNSYAATRIEPRAVGKLGSFCLFLFFRSLARSQANTRTTTVFVDEFDLCDLKLALCQGRLARLC
jgi:hypothetical protein